MTKLKFLNKFILQWFFVRLTRVQEKIACVDKIISYDIMPDGSLSARSIGLTQTFQWYSLQYFVVPTTGWNTDFKYLGERKFFVLTSKKIV